MGTIPEQLLKFENEAFMLYRLGRFLQLLGLLICPVGIAGNVARPEEITLKTSLLIAAAGMAIFFLGWLLQQANRPR
jgi:hypothetical protein